MNQKKIFERMPIVRKTEWDQDDNTFGRKMLKKMGWSIGKGLGKNEDGNNECIKLKLKDNSRGLGYAPKSYDDTWVQHYDAFENVLATLNQANNSDSNSRTNSDNNSAANSGTDLPKTSLQMKAKISKSRSAYHKFTRGKDLSRYNADDLACVLGSKKSTLKSKKQSEKGEVEFEEKKFSNNPTSVKEYFSNFSEKLARLTGKDAFMPLAVKAITSGDNFDDEDSLSRPMISQKNNKMVIEKLAENHTEEKSSKKHGVKPFRKLLKKATDSENEIREEVDQDSVMVEDNVVKQSKKKKRKHKENRTTEDDIDISNSHENAEIQKLDTPVEDCASSKTPKGNKLTSYNSLVDDFYTETIKEVKQHVPFETSPENKIVSKGCEEYENPSSSKKKMKKDRRQEELPDPAHVEDRFAKHKNKNKREKRNDKLRTKDGKLKRYNSMLADFTSETFKQVEQDVPVNCELQDYLDDTCEAENTCVQEDISLLSIGFDTPKTKLTGRSQSILRRTKKRKSRRVVVPSDAAVLVLHEEKENKLKVENVDENTGNLLTKKNKKKSRQNKDSTENVETIVETHTTTKEKTKKKAKSKSEVCEIAEEIASSTKAKKRLKEIEDNNDEEKYMPKKKKKRFR